MALKEMIEKIGKDYSGNIKNYDECVKIAKIINSSILEALQKIITIQKQIYDPESLFPIYNQDGDLLWPKEMSYEKVKEFIEEGDKEKEKSES